MIHAVIEGVILGLTIAFMVGPAFFSLIQTSLSSGMKNGTFLAVGISLSDASLIILTSFGALSIASNDSFQLIFGIVGSAVLLGFGIYNLRSKVIIHKPKDIELPGISKSSHPLIYVLKGFILNFANPFLWIFWLTIAVAINTRYDSMQNYIIFFISTIVTVFATDLFKCFISGKIKNFLSNKTMFIINRIVGIMFIIFGVVLLVRVLWFNN